MKSNSCSYEGSGPDVDSVRDGGRRVSWLVGVGAFLLSMGALTAPGAAQQCPCNADVYPPGGGDGAVEPMDLLCMLDAVLSGVGSCMDNGDVNCDGNIDWCDLTIVLSASSGVCNGFPGGDCCEVIVCGACCIDGGMVCAMGDQQLCEENAGGVYMGDGTYCTPHPCDCNENGVPDGDDIADETSADCNGNGLPDECEDADPTTVGGCCIPETGDCSVITEAECAALDGVWFGPCTVCPWENVGTVIEPGGDIFEHIIKTPVDCPRDRGRGGQRDCGSGYFYDAWESSSDGMMCHNFGVTGSPPIPADFFGPGSEPFTGSVCLVGEPLGPTPPYGDFGAADTIIQRSSDPFGPCDPPSDTVVDIAVDVVALSLKSIAPIEVIIDGQPTYWDAVVDLSEVTPPAGSLAVLKTHCNGGLYTSALNVLPRFTFTNVEDPEDQQVLDTGLEGIDPVQLIQEDPYPWTGYINPLLGATVDTCTDFHAGIEDPHQIPEGCDCDDEDDCTIFDHCAEGFCVGTCIPRRYADVYPIPAGEGPIGDGAVTIRDTLCILDGAGDKGDCLSRLPSGAMIGDIYPCDDPDGAIEVMDTLSVLDAANGNPGCYDHCTCE